MPNMLDDNQVWVEPFGVTFCTVLSTQGGGLQLQLDLWSDYLDKLAVISPRPVRRVAWITA